MNQLKTNIDQGLLEYVKYELKNKFDTTLKCVSLIVQKNLKELKDHLSKSDLSQLNEILKVWEKDFVRNIFEHYHQSMIKFIQNEIV